MRSLALALVVTASLTTAFFARELLGDAAVGAALEGAGSGIDVDAGRTMLESK